jgi:aldose 1-epimerase
MKCYKKSFGKLPSGEKVHIFHLENDNGVVLELIEYGAIIHRLIVPDRSGACEDVVMGQDSLEKYINNPSCSAAVVGRCANRIADATFSINGQRYTLEQNNGTNNLHSGSGNYASKLFSGIINEEERDKVSVTLYFKDTGQGGFPGNVENWVTYSLDNEGTVEIYYKSVPDTDTVINLTNHAYFNLSGHKSGSIKDHLLQINSEYYLPNGKMALPTGEVHRVAGTDMDFNEFRLIGEGLNSGETQIVKHGGYDHNYCLCGRGYRKVAGVRDPKSGRGMEVYTDMPGMQLYTANADWKNLPGKDGALYHKYGGLCLETQFFPNAVNASHFPSPIFRAGEVFESVTAFKFYTY